MAARALTVAWFSYFPVEWLPGVPEAVARLPRLHPASWQRVLLAEMEHIPDLRLHVIVLRKQFERDLKFQRNGVTFHLVKTPSGLRAPSLFWVDTILIRRVLRRIRPDLVHAWGTEQGAALVANRLGYRRVATVQGLISWYAQVSPPNRHDKLAGFLENHTLSSRKTELVTGESRFVVQYLQQRFPSLRVEHVDHVPDPIFHQVTRKPQTSPLRLIFIGAFDHRKGGDVLLGSLDQLKNELAFELIVIGKPRGAFLQSLQSSVSPEFWRRIVFKERLTQMEVAQELSTATMLLCTSRADTGPVAVKEAVVAGVPVIGTAVGGIPDYVFPGLNGVLCSPGSNAEFIEAIRAAFCHSQFSWGQVDAPTLARVRAYLSPQLMGQKFLGIYRRLDGRGS